MSYVYKFLDYDDNIIYIGKTNNLEKRMQQHFNGLGHLPIECYENVNKIFYIQVDGKTNVDMYETFLINKYFPKYNIEKQFRERLDFHKNNFINIEEIEWNELFFRFTKNGIQTSKQPIGYEFFKHKYSNTEKAMALLEYNFYQMKYRQGLYKHFLPHMLHDNEQILEYYSLLHSEIMKHKNIEIDYCCFDEPISNENNAFEYVAINIKKIENINLELLLILVQSKMLVRITSKIYGIVAHTPYALKKFDQNYYFNEYEL